LTIPITFRHNHLASVAALRLPDRNRRNGDRLHPGTLIDFTGIRTNVLHRWRREFHQGPGNAFPGLGQRRWEESRLAQLERKIGQQALEIDFLKGCLQRIEEQRYKGSPA